MMNFNVARDEEKCAGDVSIERPGSGDSDALSKCGMLLDPYEGHSLEYLILPDEIYIEFSSISNSKCAHTHTIQRGSG